MSYFFDTLETIPEGVGFPAYSPLHLTWLMAFVLFCLVGSLLYRRCGEIGRQRWRKTMAGLMVADEIFKHTMLLIGGRWIPEYLPLHLCSINIFLIALHAWKPSQGLGNYLYTVSIPAVNQRLDCTAFSHRTQQWYDHTIMLDPATLPEGTPRVRI